MKYILIFLLGLTLFGCNEHPEAKSTPKINTELEDDSMNWLEGRPYYNKGADTTICGEPYSLDTIDGNTLSSVKYRDCYSRRWEHKYTPGGQMIDVWYWDDKTESWYSMPKTGDYYVFRWIYSTKNLLNR